MCAFTVIKITTLTLSLIRVLPHRLFSTKTDLQITDTITTYPHRPSPHRPSPHRPFRCITSSISISVSDCSLTVIFVKMPIWKTAESYQRLLAAMVASQDLKVRSSTSNLTLILHIYAIVPHSSDNLLIISQLNFRQIAKYYGEGPFPHPPSPPSSARPPPATLTANRNNLQ